MVNHIPGQVILPASALMERAATQAAEECATAVTGGKCSDDLIFLQMITFLSLQKYNLNQYFYNLSLQAGSHCQGVP